MIKKVKMFTEHSENSSESDDEEENESVEEDYQIDASDSELSEEDNVRANNDHLKIQLY